MILKLVSIFALTNLLLSHVASANSQNSTAAVILAMDQGEACLLIEEKCVRELSSGDTITKSQGIKVTKGSIALYSFQKHQRMTISAGGTLFPDKNNTNPNKEHALKRLLKLSERKTASMMTRSSIDKEELCVPEPEHQYKPNWVLRCELSAPVSIDESESLPEISYIQDNLPISNLLKLHKTIMLATDGQCLKLESADDLINFKDQNLNLLVAGNLNWHWLELKKAPAECVQKSQLELNIASSKLDLNQTESEKIIMKNAIYQEYGLYLDSYNIISGH